jgi:hypothetical protein
VKAKCYLLSHASCVSHANVAGTLLNWNRQPAGERIDLLANSSGLTAHDAEKWRDNPFMLTWRTLRPKTERDTVNLIGIFCGLGGS